MLPYLRTRIVAANRRWPLVIAASGRHAQHWSRRGIATIWVLAALPVVLTLLVMIVDGGNLWVARTELRNALDAAALSAAKTWGEGGTTAQARLDAHDAFNSNTILGTQYSLSTFDGGGCGNGNSAPSTTAEILLGSITSPVTGLAIDYTGTPVCPGGTFGVRTRKVVSVPSVASAFLGLSVNPYLVTCESSAQFACGSGPPRVIHVNSFTACP